MIQGQVAKETWRCSDSTCKNVNPGVKGTCLKCGIEGPGSWKCFNDACKNINPEVEGNCVKCGIERPQTWRFSDTTCNNESPDLTEKCLKSGTQTPHSWKCFNEACKNINPGVEGNCVKCGIKRPQNIRKKKKKPLRETLSYKWSCQSCNKKCSTLTCEGCKMKCHDIWECSGCGEINLLAVKRCITCKLELINLSETAVGQRTLWQHASVSSTFKEDKTRRILVVGIVGAGKSSFANSILGKPLFKSAPSFQPVTENYTCGTCQRDGKDLIVFDTPGFLGAQLEENVEDIESVYRLFQSCFWATCPGFHAIAIVIGIGRFTQEHCEVIENIKKIFGPDCMKYVVIVFTKIDSLEGRSLEDVLKTADERLKNYLKESFDTYVGINNKATGDSNDKQIENFIKKVEEVFDRNDRSHYTSEIYEYVYNELRKEAQKRKENEISTRLSFRFRGIFSRIKQWWNEILEKKEKEEVTVSSKP